MTQPNPRRIVIPAEALPHYDQAAAPVNVYPNATLRAVSLQSVDAMERVRTATMLQAAALMAQAVGLSACQIMDPAPRVIAICAGAEAWVVRHNLREKRVRTIVIFDPVIVAMSAEFRHQTEGCISLPYLYGTVERPEWVEVAGRDALGRERSWRFSRIEAAIACHEIDHLDGLLFIDRADPETLMWNVPIVGGPPYREPVEILQEVPHGA